MTRASAAPASSVLAGIALMMAGAGLFPLMNAFAKSLVADFPVIEVTWARFLGHFVLATLVFWPRRGANVFRTAHPWRQLLRSLVFFGSNLSFVAALPYVALATASSIMFTAPIIVTALSVVFLGERVGPWRWSAVLIGFVGALVIIRPGSASFNAGTLLVLGAACCYATYQLLTRYLAPYDAPDTQILYTALVGAVASSLVVPFVGHLPHEPEHVFGFLAIGCIGAFAHFLVIGALKRAAASVIAPIGYVELVGATVLGYLVFGNLPDAATWAGAGLIIGSGLVIAYREAVRGRARRGARAHPGRAPEVMLAIGLTLIAIALGAYLLG